MYWALNEIWELEKHLKCPIAYRNIPRELNTIPDDMCHRALAHKEPVTFHKGEVPDDAPSNQMEDIY